MTEYTSFLVLENDAEYKRWKIERRNSRRMDRDRKALPDRRTYLKRIRNKAVADIGPQPLLAKGSQPPAHKVKVQKPAGSPAPANQPQQQAKPRQRSKSRDFGSGSGPVGPLFVGLAWWLTRRKRRK